MKILLTCIKDYEGFKRGNQYIAMIYGNNVHIHNVNTENGSIGTIFTRIKTADYFIDSVEHREEQINKLIEST